MVFGIGVPCIMLNRIIKRKLEVISHIYTLHTQNWHVLIMYHGKHSYVRGYIYTIVQ